MRVCGQSILIAYRELTDAPNPYERDFYCAKTTCNRCSENKPERDCKFQNIIDGEFLVIDPLKRALIEDHS